MHMLKTSAFYTRFWVYLLKHHGTILKLRLYDNASVTCLLDVFVSMYLYMYVIYIPSNPAEADKSERGLAVPCGLAGPGGLPLPSGPHGRTGGTGGDVGPLKRISASTFSAL